MKSNNPCSSYLLLNEQPVLTFLTYAYTGCKTQAELSFKYRFTYSHLTNVTKKFIEAGLIDKKLVGRCTRITYTEKGLETRKGLIKLLKIIELSPRAREWIDKDERLKEEITT